MSILNRSKSLNDLNFKFDNDFIILTLNEYVKNDKKLMKNIINTCNMYCGKYYINIKNTFQKYLKKKLKNKEIYVVVKKIT